MSYSGLHCEQAYDNYISIEWKVTQTFEENLQIQLLVFIWKTLNDLVYMQVRGK